MVMNTFDTYKEKGNNFFKQGCYESAIESYDKCIELESWNPVGYSNKAMALIKMGLYEKAIQVCTTGKQKLNPLDTKHIALKKKLDYRLDMAERLSRKTKENTTTNLLNNKIESDDVNQKDLYRNISKKVENIDLDIVPVDSLPPEFASL